MSESLADDRCIHPAGFRQRRPCMACHLSRQLLRDTQFFAYQLQMPVQPPQRAFLVKLPFPPLVLPEERKNIFAFGIAVLFDQALYFRDNLHLQRRPRFATSVIDVIAVDIRLLQVIHIHEAHAPGIEKEQENITSPYPPGFHARTIPIANTLIQLHLPERPSSSRRDQRRTPT